MPSLQDATVRYEVMLCAVDQYGKVIVHSQACPPYGYHHIYEVDTEGNKWRMAMVASDVPRHRVMQMAQILADGRPVALFEFYVPE